MGYYMRFFDTSNSPLTIKAIENGLKTYDAAYRLDIPAVAAIPQADVYLGDELYGEIELQQSGDGLFEDEIQQWRGSLEDSDGDHRERVRDVVHGTKQIVCVRVLSQGRDSETTLRGLEPLWAWLFANREGLLHADGEGFYDENDLILNAP